MRCNECPVASDIECGGEVGTHPVFCRWARSGEPDLIETIRLRATLPKAPGRVSPNPFGSTAQRAWDERAATCLYASRDGDGSRRCWKGAKGPAGARAVDRADCLSCLSGWPKPPAGGRCCGPPEPPRADALTIYTYLASWGGYGQLAEQAGRGLERHGVRVSYLEIGLERQFLPPSDFLASRRVETAPPGPVLQMLVPESPLLNGRDTVVFTMWETTRIRKQWVDIINGARALIVPCRWNAEGFRASGVTVPIHVVPLGVDPAEGFVPKDPSPPGRPFTVGMAGRVAHGGVRKGLQEGIDAFAQAFPKGEDVRLLLKVFPDCVPRLQIPDDPRIVVQATPIPSMRDVADWYAGIDVLLVPSKGEGWGLHTQQAMACARPVIAANYGGTAEFFSAECGWELEYDVAPSGAHYERIGDWCVPRKRSMVDALRQAHDDPDGRRAKGEAAAVRAAEFTWHRTGDELARVLQAIGLISTPALAKPAFWPPCPHREPCGCDRPKCLHPARGPVHGSAEPWIAQGGRGGTTWRVTAADCRRCAAMRGVGSNRPRP